MFRPVGDLPPSIYWRRRLTFLASLVALIVLIVLTAHVLTSGGSTPTAAGTSGSTTATAPQPSTPAPTHPSTAGQSTAGAVSSSGSSGSSQSSSAAPKPCTPTQLSLSAAVGQPSYSVGEAPVLSIVVKNVSTAPCTQDLADPQIVLRVYNGESRVWGSHDCKVEPGTDVRTLLPGSSVRVSIVWSGLSSQPRDCSNRQRAGAGTYTLYASLASREGTAAQFTIR